MKQFIKVMKALSDPNRVKMINTPYSANMIANLKHWLDDEKEIKALQQILPKINRLDIVGK